MSSDTSTSENSPSFSIVIPAYNEANRLEQTLGRITTYLAGSDVPDEHEAEIIVVNDGSMDATGAIVQQGGFEPGSISSAQRFLKTVHIWLDIRVLEPVKAFSP